MVTPGKLGDYTPPQKPTMIWVATLTSTGKVTYQTNQSDL